MTALSTGAWSAPDHTFVDGMGVVPFLEAVFFLAHGLSQPTRVAKNHHCDFCNQHIAHHCIDWSLFILFARTNDMYLCFPQFDCRPCEACCSLLQGTSTVKLLRSSRSGKVFWCFGGHQSTSPDLFDPGSRPHETLLDARTTHMFLSQATDDGCASPWGS